MRGSGGSDAASRTAPGGPVAAEQRPGTVTAAPTWLAMVPEGGSAVTQSLPIIDDGSYAMTPESARALHSATGKRAKRPATAASASAVTRSFSASSLFDLFPPAGSGETAKSGDAEAPLEMDGNGWFIRLLQREPPQSDLPGSNAVATADITVAEQSALSEEPPRTPSVCRHQRTVRMTEPSRKCDQSPSTRVSRAGRRLPRMRGARDDGRDVSHLLDR